MTGRPTWSSTVSVGNILTIITFLVVSLASFFTLQNLAQTNADKVHALNQETAALEARVVSLEISRAANDQRFANILTLLDRIDTRLERIEREALE